MSSALDLNVDRLLLLSLSLVSRVRHYAFRIAALEVCVGHVAIAQVGPDRSSMLKALTDLLDGPFFGVPLPSVSLRWTFPLSDRTDPSQQLDVTSLSPMLGALELTCVIFVCMLTKNS